MKYLSRISTTVLGLMFLVSAFAKAWDAESFAELLLQYGPAWFSVGAPIIICMECLLGVALLTRFRPRHAAVAGDIFLVLVSYIFAYGLAAKGIEDCGCFGFLSKLHTGKPWMTFVRNAVFIAVSIPAIIDKQAQKERYVLPKGVAAMVTVAAACFITGLAMRRTFELPDLPSVHTDSRQQTMEKLNAIYPFSADSSYVVYLFSFTCPHCQNSFANVQQYEQLHVVDKVVGIAVENDEARERFYRLYKPEIDILTIPNDQMSDITGSLPILLLIEGDTIQNAQSGSVTSPGIFLP